MAPTPPRSPRRPNGADLGGLHPGRPVACDDLARPGRLVGQCDGRQSWTAPQELAGGVSGITHSDLAAIVTINNGVGVFWSNQTVGDEAFYFQAHLDASPDGTWQARETAYSGSAAGRRPYEREGRLHRSGSRGRQDEGHDHRAVDRRPPPDDRPNVAGHEDRRRRDREPGSATRPILVIDEEHNEANVFMTSQVDGGFITRRTASLSTLDFGAPSAGQRSSELGRSRDQRRHVEQAGGHCRLGDPRPRVGPDRDPHHPALPPWLRRIGLPGRPGRRLQRDPVSPAQAADGRVRRRLDRHAGDLGVELRRPASGANNTSALPSPSHIYSTAGSYTVSLTVTNILGSDPEVKTDYVTVLPAPTATSQHPRPQGRRHWA